MMRGVLPMLLPTRLVQDIMFLLSQSWDGHCFNVVSLG